MWVSKLPDENC